MKPAYSHMNTNLKVEGSPSSGIGVVARYFLRRLAIAHRKSNKPRVQYANALAETILIFVTAPACSLIAVTVILALKWAPNPVTRLFGLAPQVEALIISALSVVVGYLLFTRRMRRYLKEDSNCFLRFGTDRDRQVVFWQKVSALVVCGILPCIALLMLGSK
jgi:hypothetical protein